MSFHILSEFIWGQVTNTHSANTFTRGLKLFWIPPALFFFNKKRNYIGKKKKKSRRSQASLLSWAVPFLPGNRWHFPELRVSDEESGAGKEWVTTLSSPFQENTPSFIKVIPSKSLAKTTVSRWGCGVAFCPPLKCATNVSGNAGGREILRSHFMARL